mmetsp:Transcript_9390/g.23120  ORF Transcript_9390/g.23120 Transcript_9390/m.23120 type:complete len:200 (+) Transcript_9390:878-1477(+)
MEDEVEPLEGHRGENLADVLRQGHVCFRRVACEFLCPVENDGREDAGLSRREEEERAVEQESALPPARELEHRVVVGGVRELLDVQRLAQVEDLLFALGIELLEIVLPRGIREGSGVPEGHDPTVDVLDLDQTPHSFLDQVRSAQPPEHVLPGWGEGLSLFAVLDAFGILFRFLLIDSPGEVHQPLWLPEARNLDPPQG